MKSYIIQKDIRLTMKIKIYQYKKSINILYSNKVEL